MVDVAMSLTCLVFLGLFTFIQLTGRWFYLKWRLVFGGWSLVTGVVAIWADFVFVGVLILTLVFLIFAQMTMLRRSQRER